MNIDIKNDSVTSLENEKKKTKFTKNLAITSICISTVMVGVNIVLVALNHSTNQDLTFAGVTGIVLYSGCIAATSYILLGVKDKEKDLDNKIKNIKQ